MQPLKTLRIYECYLAVGHGPYSPSFKVKALGTLICRKLERKRQNSEAFIDELCQTSCFIQNDQ